MQQIARQRGLSLLGWLVLLLVGGVIAVTAIRLVPVYLEYGTIRTAINNVLSEGSSGLQSDREIRDGLARRFGVNNVTSLDARDIVITKQGGQIVVSVDYEVREPLFGNVDLVVSFKKDFAKTIQ